MSGVGDNIADFFSDLVHPIGDLGTVGNGVAGVSHGTFINDGIDTDIFKAQLIAGITYRITMEGTASGFELNNPHLILAANVSTPLQSDDDSGIGTNAYIVFTPDTTGTYFMAAQGVAGATGFYQLSVTALNPFQGAAETTFAFMSGSSELPSSEAANLPQFAQLQFTTGTQVGVLSPTVYMFEALGLALSEISPALQGILSPGSASDADFVNLVYATVFGVQPGVAQAQHFLTQLDFYETIYLASGAFGQDQTRIETLARGATIGQMLGVNADLAASNAAAATGNLINGNGIATVGTSAAMDFDLL
jgi:hypothetical protein